MKKFSLLLSLLMMVISSMSAQCVKTTGTNVRLRYGPGLEYGVFCTIKAKGTKMTYIGKSGDNNWYQVHYKGQDLYISRDYASLCECDKASVSPSHSVRPASHQPTQCIIGANRLRLRVGPGTEYDYLVWTGTGKTVYLNKGDILPFLGTMYNGFYKVNFQGVECWVSADYSTIK